AGKNAAEEAVGAGASAHARQPPTATSVTTAAHAALMCRRRTVPLWWASPEPMRVGEVIRCPTVEYLLERELVQPEGGEVCFRARDMTTGSRVRLALWPS